MMSTTERGLRLLTSRQADLQRYGDSAGSDRSALVARPQTRCGFSSTMTWDVRRAFRESRTWWRVARHWQGRQPRHRSAPGFEHASETPSFQLINARSQVEQLREDMENHQTPRCSAKNPHSHLQVDLPPAKSPRPAITQFGYWQEWLPECSECIATRRRNNTSGQKPKTRWGHLMAFLGAMAVG